MEYNFTKENKGTVLSLKGSLLADVQSKDVLQKLTEMIQDGDVNFVADLSELKFINSSGLGMLLTALTKARKAGGDVVLCSIPEQVQNLLVITKLNSIFTTVETVDEAFNQF